MIVYVAHVQTESSDHYTWVYDYEPSRAEVIERCWQHEGCGESLEFYEDTTCVFINKETVTTR